MKKTIITILGWSVIALIPLTILSHFIFPELLPDLFDQFLIVCLISGFIIIWVGQIVGDVEKNGSVILKLQYNLVRGTYSAARILMTFLACSISGAIIGIVCVLVLWMLAGNYSSIETEPARHISTGNNTWLVVTQRVRPEGFGSLGLLLFGSAAAFFAPAFTAFLVVDSLTPDLKIPTDWKHIHRRPVGGIFVLGSYVSAVFAATFLLSIIF